MPQIDRDNALARRPYRSYTDADRVDAILTNPPFGGMEEPGVESNFPAQFQTKETADLFLALIVHLLRDGGQGAIVLPDGSLFGEGVKTRLKEHLLERCNLHTVVRLPNGVFAPYTDINTNLLFFTKGEPTREVWYFEHPLPAGYKKYTKTRPIRIEEFDGEKAWWHDRQESEHAWRVTIDEIKARNYNLDIKNPNSIDAAHGDPARLLADYRRLEGEIAAARRVEGGADRGIGTTVGARHSNARLSQPRFSHLMKPRPARQDPVGMPAPTRWEQHIMSLDLLFPNFETLIRTPEDVARLNEAILQLAVQGKLVPQDPADEPASELLKRIRAEKRRLVKEGKIKEEDQLPRIAESEIPFELPNSWLWCRLGEVVESWRLRFE